MATPVFACGAECGLHLATAHIALVNSASFSTTTMRTGLRAFRFNPASGDATIETVNMTASSIWVTRAYFYFTSLPTGNCQIIEPFGINEGAYFKASDSKVYAAHGAWDGGTYGSTGVAVTTGQWYLIECLVDMTLTDHVIKVRVGGADASDLTKAGAGAGVTATRDTLGTNGTSINADVFVDDILISHTAADYPLGAGYVLSYIPNADGTHNVAGANDFEKTLTGTDITNATTDAYQLIDDRPLPSTAVDFINGIAPLNSTDYVEWQYEDSVESVAPRAVDAVFIHHDASGAGTNNFTVTLREAAGGTSANIHSGTTNVGATLTGKRAIFVTVPGTSDAWTTTKFNALRSRFLVSDASPDPYIDAIMLEAEFPPAAADTRVPRSTPYPQLLSH